MTSPPGMKQCRAAQFDAVFVLGHSDYYPRHGFEPAAPHDLHYESESFDPNFFVQELRAGALKAISGLV